MKHYPTFFESLLPNLHARKTSFIPEYDEEESNEIEWNKNFKKSFNSYALGIMNQEIAQSEDKTQITDESNCKNSTLVNLLQKWKKLIELKKIDATRKDSLSLASGNYPKLKRTSGICYPEKQMKQC